MRAEDLSAEDVIDALHLTPHPTCGFVAETYRSRERIAAGGLASPFADGRPVGSALYFLVTPERPVRWHRIRNDQLYHRYLGDALDVLALYPDGTYRLIVIGADLAAGEQVQLLIPGYTFHAARVRDRQGWFLGGSTEWPGVEAPDVETADASDLARRFPGAAALIEDFIRPGRD
jgi:predicted cupin superfamily sugar epimerase